MLSASERRIEADHRAAATKACIECGIDLFGLVERKQQRAAVDSTVRRAGFIKPHQPVNPKKR